MQEAERKAQELVNILHRKIAVKSTSCEITASIGVAAAPQAGSDFEMLYRNADTALYQTKGSGKNGYTIFREDGAVLQ